MAAIYIDEDVSKSFLQLLGGYGHTVQHARTTPGMTSVTDGKQLTFAIHHASVLLTHNGKDFHLLHDAWRRWTDMWQLSVSHEGILLIPQHVDKAIIARAVHDRITGSGALSNEFYEWTAHQGWQHISYRPWHVWSPASRRRTVQPARCR
jgi:hypothetical protein